ncbi:MAG: hypothetical protein IJU16_03285 [Clostridia bacterium]|nr:hypothetical protein [Clostridia bacterium]
MNTAMMLEQLRQKALADNAVRQALLDTRGEPDPLFAFCDVCRSLGFELYPMDIVNAGEEDYAAMRRSTNGGGENSPLLPGEDDYYELFLAAIE